MSGYPGTARQQGVEITHLFSGLGPRNAMMLKYFIVTLLAEKKSKLDLVKAVGKHHKYRLVIFEQQDESGLTGGNAFQPDCDAALNNTISSRPDIANLADIPLRCKKAVDEIIDLQNRIATSIGQDLEGHAQFLEEKNIACSALFRNAIDSDGKLDATRAFTARGVIGGFQNDSVKEAVALAAKELPELAIEFHYRHAVLSGHHENRLKPSFEVKDLNKPDVPPITVEGDFLHYANGTTWAVPFTGEVGDISFSGVPGHKALGDYFDTRALLSEAPLTMPGAFHEARVLRPGAKIGISGLGLSAFDMVCIAANYTSAVKADDKDPRRWSIDPREAEKYRGLFQFFNRSEGIVPPPRFVYSQEWYGARPVLPTRQFHALLLQREFDWLAMAKVFIYANAARTLRVLPQEINKRRSTKEMFAHYRKQTAAYYAEPAKEKRGSLEAALLRSQYQAIANGGGIERDPAAAETKLIGEAPLSRTDIAGWPIQRAMIYELTRPHIARLGSNSDFINNWNELQLFLTASPPEIHDLAAAMFECGMADYTCAAYSEVGDKLVDGKIDLKGKRLDAMLASRILTSEADPVFGSLAGKVKETVHGQPDYAKGRILQTLDSDLIHATDNGSGGFGKRVRDAEGKMSLVGAQWHDTNAHLSANQQMPINALAAVTASTLLGNGDRRPLDTMSNLYHTILPSASAFDEEAATFEKDWKEVHAQLCFLKLCDALAVNGEQYREYTDNVFSAGQRDAFVANFGGATGSNRQALSAYRNNLKILPAFKPKRLNEFEEQFVDYRPGQMRDIWAEACKRVTRN